MNPVMVQMHSKLCDVQLILNQAGQRLDNMESTKNCGCYADSGVAGPQGPAGASPFACQAKIICKEI